MPNMIMLVGMPGSGKSTWVKNNFTLPKDGYTLLSTDNFIEFMAKLNGKTYNDIFKDTIKAAEKNLQEILSITIEGDYGILWDQTNLSVKSRKKKLSKIPSHYHKKAVVFIQTLPKLLEVNEKRKAYGRALGEKLITDMLMTFQFPTLEEGFDEIELVYSKAE